MDGVFEISALVSELVTVWVTDLRVFSPEEADPASGPAMEVLIPGSMRPGEAYWPEGPSPPPVCCVPSVEVCTSCPWSSVLGGTLRLRKRYAFGSMVYGDESATVRWAKFGPLQFSDESGHCPDELGMIRLTSDESGHCPDDPKCCWRALLSFIEK